MIDAHASECVGKGDFDLDEFDDAFEKKTKSSSSKEEDKEEEEERNAQSNENKRKEKQQRRNFARCRRRRYSLFGGGAPIFMSLFCRLWIILMKVEKDIF